MKIDTKKTKYDFMLEHNKNCMDLTALSFGNRKISYEEMHDRINQCVRLLRSKGVQKGDVIGICALNAPESVYLLYALDIIGAIAVGYSPFENKEEIKGDIKLTRPKMVITVDMCHNNFKKWQKAYDFSTMLYSPVASMDDKKIKLGYGLLKLKGGNFTLSRKNFLETMMHEDHSDISTEPAPYEEDGLKDILFTGGSTGFHKGVELTDNGLNTVVQGMMNLFPEREGFVHLGNIPFGHMAYGRAILHYSLCSNMEYALTLKAMPNDFYDELVRTHAEGAVGGPPHWVSLIEQTEDGFRPSRKIKPGSLSSLRYATSGGEAKKKNTVAAINGALAYGGSSALLGDGLGATETWACMIINNARTSKRDTLGVPIEGLDIKLINQKTNEEPKDGEDGLLYVSGPSVMRKYYNNPEATDEVISYDENGKKWLNTGDIVQKTEKGDYIYTGRLKRSFVSGCDNIYPEELESLLVELPEIREVVVTPISDEMVQYIPRYHISLYNPKTNRKKLEEKIKGLVLTAKNENWLPGSIVYYDKPLERMQNSKVNITYYVEQDKIAEENGEINHEEAKVMRLKKYK